MMEDSDLPVLSSEELWTSFCENSSEHIILVGLDYSIQYINYTVADFTPEQVIGKSVIDLTPVDCHQVAIDCFNHVKETGKFDIYETKYISNDQQTLYFEVRVSPIFDNSGTLSGYISSSNDITKRKTIENNLHESEKRFRAIVTNSIPIIFMFDLDGIIQLSEGNMLANIGLKPGEIVGMDVFELYKDYPKVIKALKIPLSGEIFSGVLEFGEQFFDVFYSPNRNSAGSVIGVIGMALDITERKMTEEDLQESEERFRHLFEYSNDAIMLLDTNGFIGCNEATLSMFGYTMGEFLTKTPADVSPTYQPDGKDSNQASFEQVGKAFKDGINIFLWSHKRKNGEVFPAEVLLSILVIDGREIIQGTVRDITERILTEEELLRGRKLESIGLLAGGIAHDFNNVLTGLFGNIELAKQKLPSDNAAFTYIQNAGQALDKATSLTQQLLTFAKGGEPLLEMISIGQVIQDAIKFSLSGSNVKTILNLQNELWNVQADKGQLSQVITNLVINADQAMPTGGTLTIRAENIRNIDNNLVPHLAGESIKLSIADNGSGISVENLKLIFDPYFTTKQTGSGLGLATVHSIITKHKGHITVDSELGNGTTFNIYLPADSTISQSTDTTSQNSSDNSNPMAGHILVMDDNEMILNLAKEMIEAFGYTVDTAVDGKEAIEKYISAQQCGKAFDVAIMDLTIPGGMGGKEAVQELLAVDPDAKVIVSSGYSSDPIMANYTEYGFKGILAKPYQLKSLENELSRLVN